MVVTGLPTAAHRDLAGPHRGAAEMHGAGAAVAGPAPVLGTGEPEDVAQRPEERHVGRGGDSAPYAVDQELDGRHGSTPDHAPCPGFRSQSTFTISQRPSTMASCR